MSRELVSIPGGFKLLPAAPGVCEQCAVDHKPDFPHNAQSLHYQYWFYGKHGRWPDWRDAMAHSSEEMKSYWRFQLRSAGVDIDAGQVNPTSAEAGHG